MLKKKQVPRGEDGTNCNGKYYGKQENREEYQVLLKCQFLEELL